MAHSGEIFLSGSRKRPRRIAAARTGMTKLDSGTHYLIMFQIL